MKKCLSTNAPQTDLRMSKLVDMMFILFLGFSKELK